MIKNQFKLLIIVSWIVLIICFIIKLCGGNWFEFKSENNNFINFCNFVDTKIWLKMILACLIYVGTTYPILCCILNIKKLSLKLNLLFIPLMIVKSIVGWYNAIIAFIIDLIITIVIPIILNKNFKRPIFSMLLVMGFQLITICIRNLSINFNLGNTFIEQTLCQIDYFIMIILYYLYTFKNKIIKKGDE